MDSSGVSNFVSFLKNELKCSIYRLVAEQSFTSRDMKRSSALLSVFKQNVRECVPDVYTHLWKPEHCQSTQ